jgi:hypothetical protein
VWSLTLRILLILASLHILVPYRFSSILIWWDSSVNTFIYCNIVHGVHCLILEIEIDVANDSQLGNTTCFRTVAGDSRISTNLY